MLEYIHGTLIEDLPPSAVIDVQGLGYQVFLPLNHFSSLPQKGEKILLYVSLVIREDSHKLFGFFTKEMRSLFNKLTELSKIGPKTALSILGHLDQNKLRQAVLENNVSALSKIPGIGKKTAERMIIDLKDYFYLKVHKETPANQMALDAIGALLNLGYHRQKAEQAVFRAQESLKGTSPQLATLIKTSLKMI